MHIKKITYILIFFMLLIFLYGFTPQTNLINNEDTILENYQLLSNQQQSTNDLISIYETNNYIDSTQYIFNKDKIKSALNEYKKTIIDLTNNSIENKDFTTYKNILNYSKKFYNTDNQLSSLISLNNKKINNLELIEYNGEIEHLSFKTLISFPDKIFNTKNSQVDKFDAEKITPYEFTNILQELYTNNFILINTNDIFTIKENTISQNKLFLPKNKKPIILSFDNVTYTSNYQNFGGIDKIIIDRNNNLATYSTKKSIQDRINYNNEFIVILENFIKTHPDFSFNGARGIIFLSGENGILGYNTNHKNASGKIEQKRVSQIIKKLSSLGWEFGSNNYKYTPQHNISNLDFAKNISLWNNEVKEIINNTPLFAFPFGTLSDYNKEREEILLNNGFKIFFYTDNEKCNLILNDNTCYMSRREICGTTLRTNKNLSHLFDCNYIYDHTTRLKPFTS